MEATLTRVGNSAAMTVNKSLREAAGFSVGDKLDVSVPASGVLVVRSQRDVSSGLEALSAARRHIRESAASWEGWPAGADADAEIEMAKAERFS